VGGYPITASAATGSGLSNYTITYTDGTLTVNAAALAITANDQSKTYGTQLDLGTTAFTVVGLVNEDTVTGVTLTSDGAAAAAPVGGYPITASAATGSGLSNYTITYTGGTLTVNAAALTVTADDKSKVYDGSVFPVGDYTVSYAGFVNGEDETVLGGMLTFTGAAVTAVVAGRYAITPEGLTSGNYEITFVDGELWIRAVPGVTMLAEANLKTSEGGDTATFSVVLDSEPTADVVIELSSSDESEGVVSPATLRFTPLNWNAAQDVTVTGVNDDEVDGHKGYLIVTSATSSADSVYDGIFVADVPVTNLDNDGIGMFGATSVVIYRVGDGAADLSNTGSAVFLDEYAPHGALIQSIAMPTGVEGDNKQLIASGTATSEGLITLSDDRQYLVLAGYATDLGGTASLSGTSGNTVPRTVGVVTYDGGIDTTTALQDFASSSNPRGAFSTNGTDLWVAGGTGGVRYTTIGSSTSTQLSTTASNLRGVHVFNGQLYVSANTGEIRVATVGEGTPKTSGHTISNLPGFPISGSPHQFFFADLSEELPGVDTVYVAWEGAGITKYSLAGEVWEAKGTVGTTSDNYRGLTGVVNEAGITLFATRKAGELVSIVDTSGYGGDLSGNVTLLASAGTNTAFRGVALAPQGLPPIEKVTPDITASPLTKVYDGQAFEVTATADDGPGGFPADNDQANFSFTFYASADLAAEPIAAPVDAGTYWVDVAYAGNAYYLPVESTLVSFTITPAPLEITASDQSKTYGTELDLGTTAFTTSGLVEGDSVTGVTLASAGAGAGAGVGDYAIVASGATGTGLANYTISYVDGTLTVAAKDLAITASDQSKTYGAELDLGTTAFTTSGLVAGDSVTGVTLTSTGAAAGAGVGDYAIVASGATGTGLANYTISYVDGTLTVAAKDLEITASDQSKTYGTELDLGTTAFTTSGLVGGDSVTGVTLTSTGAAAGAGVGDYPIVASGATGTGLANYTISYVDGTLTVTAKDLEITASDQSKTYGTELDLGTTAFTTSGLVEGDSVTSVTLTSAGAAANADVGTYPIVASNAIGTDLENYTISYIDGTLTVTADVTPGSISGIVWRDSDSDGERDADEPVLPEQVVFLDSDDNGVLDDGEPTAITDDDGWYVFPDLTPDTYVVRLVLQDGWEQTYPVDVPSGDGALGSSGFAPDRGAGGPDVNGDGYVSAQDVLLIVNAANSAATASGGVMEASAAGDPLDVNGDGVISALDALLVVNWINRPTRGLAEAASGEGGAGLSDAPVAHVVVLAAGEHRDKVDFGTRPEDTVAPMVVQVGPVTPDPRQTTISTVTVVMSEQIDLSSFDYADLALKLNGNNVPMDGRVTVAHLSGVNYQISGLENFTLGQGEYELIVDATGIMDLWGNAGVGSESDRWIKDNTAPTSGITPLVSPATSKEIEINIVGHDVVPAEGVVVSGVAWYDVYVSVDQSAFALWQSLPADNPTATYMAESGRKYGFRTLARDAADNVESKPLASDAWTIIPDLDAPETKVHSYEVNDEAAVIQLNFSGTDTGGSGLASFQLFVQVDGGAVTPVGTYAAGAPVGGVYSGSATYAAITDGDPHTYRFYTIGIDGRGNVEAAPDAPLDVTVTETFSPPATLAVTGFDVQRGALQRSYIQYVDVTFNMPGGIAAIIASMNDGDPDTDRLRLTRYNLNGQSPVDVPLDGVNLQAVDKVLTLDFGDQGIGGDRNGLAGNGYYKLSIDTDGDLSNDYEVDKYFYRLAGDTNRDRRVDSLDLLAVNTLLSTGGYDVNADVNGDGVINASDRLLVMRGRNQVLAPQLPLDD
jgi:hypothetical protein